MTARDYVDARLRILRAQAREHGMVTPETTTREGVIRELEGVLVALDVFGAPDEPAF